MAKAGGRPPKFKSAEELERKIDEYFKDCDGTPILLPDGAPLKDKAGEVILAKRHPPTVTGLALALGFKSRQSLLDYGGKERFADTIARAKLRIEAYAEERLYDRDGQRGAEFNLKYNFRWAEDRQQPGAGKEQGVVLLPEVHMPGAQALPGAPGMSGAPGASELPGISGALELPGVSEIPGAQRAQRAQKAQKAQEVPGDA